MVVVTYIASEQLLAGNAANSCCLAMAVSQLAIQPVGSNNFQQLEAFEDQDAGEPIMPAMFRCTLLTAWWLLASQL